MPKCEGADRRTVFDLKESHYPPSKTVVGVKRLQKRNFIGVDGRSFDPWYSTQLARVQ